MVDLQRDAQALTACQQRRTLLGIAEAIVAHRDLATLFHDLAGRLGPLVRFDYLALVLHDAASATTRLHILETSGHRPELWFTPLPVEETPLGVVLQTQQ